MKSTCLSLLLAGLFSLILVEQGNSQTPPPIPAPQTSKSKASLPAKVQRVLVLGDSITYAGEYVTDIETYFVTRYPKRHIEFINVGLPSETTCGLSEQGHANGLFPRPDLHERLDRVLSQTKPDFIIACYGINDGIYLPFSQERFDKFTNGVAWLHEKALSIHAKILHATPPTYDEKLGGVTGYNSVLSRYSEWLLEQSKNGWDVVDLHGPMDAYLAKGRAQKADFAFSGDGVHPNALGHWLMARQILIHLGAKDLKNAENAEEMVKDFPRGNEILKLIGERQAMMKDAWLSATGHKRPGMNKGLPLDQAQAKAAELDKKIRP